MNADRGSVGERPAGAGLHQAPRFLLLLHRMGERAGERRCVFIGFPSSILPPRSSRGEDGELDAALPAGATETVALPQGTGPEGFNSFARNFLDNPHSFVLWI